MVNLGIGPSGKYLELGAIFINLKLNLPETIWTYNY
jgi:hypothetical protein